MGESVSKSSYKSAKLEACWLDNAHALLKDVIMFEQGDVCTGGQKKIIYTQI